MFPIHQARAKSGEMGFLSEVGPRELAYAKSAAVAKIVAGAPNAQTLYVSSYFGTSADNMVPFSIRKLADRALPVP